LAESTSSQVTRAARHALRGHIGAAGGSQGDRVAAITLITPRRQEIGRPAAFR
jgi:hypothetical protein